ncbi:aspartyl-phosphate phosphatase Spo0E family protein [Anaeromicrobium sediminis]|uniref:Aspartyl-phosphate phosphatase Spo0E family protein n=1 Tax=Anaeromicrobium sediminis TaxID=1478221 RepID=A0A267ML40_9FIRM|nr:aspartyl-phosphate phosphatase Spo0E family protein [Anaeromicrobium sediminis]PAB60301.1 hypothetical protein CCE28_05230 [Anaeromicrobium sediminis]
MNQVEQIIYELEELRGQLNGLIKEKTELMEPQIIETSQKLDRVLNRYDKLINNLGFRS